MGRQQRQKGIRGEQEVANLLKPIFPGVKRAWEAAEGLGYDLDGTGEYRFQIKRNEIGVSVHRLEDVPDGPGIVPVLVQRRSRGRWIASLYMDDLLKLIDQAWGREASR